MRCLNCVLMLAGLGALVGCGGAEIEGLALAGGVVTYQGQPVEGAIVTFSPTGEARAASGLTDAEGRFALTTLNAGDGVMAGEYLVTISKTELASKSLSPDEMAAYIDEHGRQPEVTTTDHLPVDYKKAETSGLTAEVTEDGENEFTFALE